MSRCKFLIGAVIAGTLLPSAAAAADYTFDVPVRLVNLPSLTGASVHCIVYSVEALSPDAGVVMGEGSAAVPVSGGAFDGVVTVEVNNRSIYPSGNARSYLCNLNGTGTARSGSTYGASPGNFRDVYQAATGATIDSLTTTVRANFP
jgi:hypothetical protein